MKILVISDTHGDISRVPAIIKEEKPEAVIHAGDIDGDDGQLAAMCGAIPFVWVKGNCDFSSQPSRIITSLGGVKICVTHGARQGMPFGRESLIYNAIEDECKVLILGHTHIPSITTEQGIFVLNPGSLSRPRQEGHRPSYAVLRCEGGEIEAEVKYLT